MLNNLFATSSAKLIFKTFKTISAYYGIVARNMDVQSTILMSKILLKYSKGRYYIYTYITKYLSESCYEKKWWRKDAISFRFQQKGKKACERWKGDANYIYNTKLTISSCFVNTILLWLCRYYVTYMSPVYKTFLCLFSLCHQLRKSFISLHYKLILFTSSVNIIQTFFLRHFILLIDWI